MLRLTMIPQQTKQKLIGRDQLTCRYLRSNLGLLLLESEVLLDEVCPDDSSDLRLQDHDHKQHDHTNEHKLMQEQENKLTMNSQ